MRQSCEQFPVHNKRETGLLIRCVPSLKIFLFVQERVERTNYGVQAPRTGINMGIGTKMRELRGTMCVYNAYFIVF